MDSESNSQFTSEQLEQLSALFSKEDLQKLNAIIAKPVEVPEELSSTEKVKERVFEILASLSGVSQTEIKESQDLYRDLGLSTYHKKSLKRPFQKIVEDFGSNKNILVKECAALKKVKDCLDLVTSKL